MLSYWVLSQRALCSPNLEVMGGASAAGRLLIELPYPFRGQGFEDEAFGRCR